MMKSQSNLFDEIPLRIDVEQIETLATGKGVRIERIVSSGHHCPPGHWYDQEEAEWVVLLSGAATLRFEDDAAPVKMKPGDFVQISAHRRHRVEWTSPDEPTVWLAVFFHDDQT